MSSDGLAMRGILFDRLWRGYRAFLPSWLVKNYTTWVEDGRLRAGTSRREKYSSILTPQRTAVRPFVQLRAHPALRSLRNALWRMKHGFQGHGGSNDQHMRVGVFE